MLRGLSAARHNFEQNVQKAEHAERAAAFSRRKRQADEAECFTRQTEWPARCRGGVKPPERQAGMPAKRALFQA
jgi:hypothetical protein